MLRKTATRSELFRRHLLDTGISLALPASLSGISFIGIIGIPMLFIAAVMTLPMNILILVVHLKITGPLLSDYAVGRADIFFLNTLALSVLVLNSWLWAFVLFRNSATPVTMPERTPESGTARPHSDATPIGSDDTP